jgi:hypothetical protein
MVISAVPALVYLACAQESHTKICFEEYQLSPGQIGLSPTLHGSSDDTATSTRSAHYKAWPCKDRRVSGLKAVTVPHQIGSDQSLSLGSYPCYCLQLAALFISPTLSRWIRLYILLLYASRHITTIHALHTTLPSSSMITGGLLVKTKTTTLNTVTHA